MSQAAPQKILVIGNGMVGHVLIDELVKKKAGQITVIGDEPRPAYDRVHLSEYFAGKTAADLAMATHELYAEWGVTLHTSTRVMAINRAAKTVSCNDGRTFSYDRLVLATGSYPFVPPITGNDQEGCLVYRTIEDLEAITAQAAKSKIGVVVGGGLLGLEAANALAQLGLETHVVEFAPSLMAVQLDSEGGAMLRRKIEALGIRVHTGKATQRCSGQVFSDTAIGGLVCASS